MKISHKLILGFLLVASLASVSTFFTLQSYDEINSSFATLIEDPTRKIEALNSLKQAGGGVISSTSEFAFVHNEAEGLGDAATGEEKEEQQIESAYRAIYSWLKRYEGLEQTHLTSHPGGLERLRSSSNELIKLSREIVDLKKRHVRGQEVLEVREVFEGAELIFLKDVEDALEIESTEQLEVQKTVAASIAFAQRRTFIIRVLTFVMAVIAGLFISFSISRRIRKLKDASQRVGSGEFDTRIDVNSRDEIGDLAHSFNKMVKDLKSSRWELASANNFTDKVMKSMVDFVVVLNMDLTIARVNQATLELNGYEEHELIGQDINILSGDRPFTQKGLDALRKTGSLSHFDKLNLNKDGSLTPISMSVSVLKDDKGEEIGIVCVGKDVSERKHAEEALRESESRFRSVTQSAVYAIVAADSKGMIVSWNDGARNIFGYEEAEILRFPLTVLMSKTDRHAHQKWMDRFAATGEARVIGKTVELQGLKKDGSEFPIELSLSSWKKGEETFYSGIISDISERKRADAEREVISEITEGVATSANLNELLELIQRSIGRVLYADNCYVALYDGQTDLISVPFCIDKYDTVASPAKLGTGLTAYVLKKGKPMLMTPEVMRELTERGEMAVVGTVPAVWLGVPLKTPEGIIGAFVVQHYEDAEAYDPRDVEFLNSVGHQIALAIERKRVEEALLISEEQHRLLFEKSPQPAFIFDLETLAFLAVNEAAVRHYGYSREELFSTVTAKDFRPSENDSNAIKRLGRARSGEDIVLESARHRKKDGTLIDVEVTLHGVPFAGRRAEIVLINDVTERKKAEEETRRLNAEITSQSERLMTIIGNVQGVVWETRTKIEEGEAFLRFDFVSDYIETMLGYSPKDCLAEPDFWLNIVHPDDRERTEQIVRAIFAGGKGGTVEFRWIAKDGHEVWIESRNTIVRDDAGKTIGLRGIAVDITDRKSFEKQLTHQALHDPLTKLANRVLFRDRVEHAVDRTGRHPSPVTVLFLDLDNFKSVNDSLGHAAGDELLIQVTERLQSCLRPSDTPARLGGDEFAILIEDIQKAGDAGAIAERIRLVLSAPFSISGTEVFISASIGMATRVDEHETPEELIRNADVAMYRSKGNGKDQCTVFENEMHDVLIKRLRLESDMRTAIEAREFEVYYQPILELQTESIMGVEALVRWNHPEHGLIPPLDFIPLADETGLIVPLGKWILEEACMQASAWQTEYGLDKSLSITVNVASRQFFDDTLLETVKNALAKSELPPRSLVLEITESTMLVNTEATIKTLTALKRLGIRLAIDDFGTGYSSLSYLQRFPVDILKIDKSFVDQIASGKEGAAVAKAIITMSETLHLRTIAEGIESASQQTELQNLGCELGQGYLFAKPLRKADMNEFLRRSALNEKESPSVVPPLMNRVDENCPLLN